MTSQCLLAVSLWLVFSYPPTYPDVIPELKFEELDEEEESGELQDGEEEPLLEQLRGVVRDP